MIGEISSPPRFGMNERIAPAPFGDAYRNSRDRRDELVAGVHDIEGDQPDRSLTLSRARHRDRNDENDVENSTHAGTRASWVPANIGFRPSQTRERAGKSAETAIFAVL